MGRITMAAMAAELAAQRAVMERMQAEIERLSADRIGGQAPAGTDPKAAMSRRGVMLAAVGAAAGLAAASVRPAPVAAASGGAFILGQSNSAGTNTTLQSPAGFALLVSSNTTAGQVISGSASATSGATIGVAGSSASTSGTAVKGVATASTGVTYGVYGQANSATGFGLYGKGRMKVTGRSFLATPVGAPASGDLSSGSISFYLDQIGNRLRVKVKYSTGAIKYGSIALA